MTCGTAMIAGATCVRERRAPAFGKGPMPSPAKVFRSRVGEAKSGFGTGWSHRYMCGVTEGAGEGDAMTYGLEADRGVAGAACWAGAVGVARMKDGVV
jgi:hypothetical protein